LLLGIEGISVYPLHRQVCEQGRSLKEEAD